MERGRGRGLCWCGVIEERNAKDGRDEGCDLDHRG